MVNIKEYLDKNVNSSCYAFVEYENKIMPIYFQKIHDEKYGNWYLESPCELFTIGELVEPIEESLLLYAKDVLEEGTDYEEYISKYLRPFVIDGWLYEIENFQCSPFLPKEVDSIVIVEEKKVFEYMMNKKVNEI